MTFDIIHLGCGIAKNKNKKFQQQKSTCWLFFQRNPDATLEENIWSGIVSLAVVFLVLSLLVMPNGE